MKDNINPDYYIDMKISPYEYITENDLPWEIANNIKYVSRHNGKNKEEDILKAIKYLQMYLERIYKIKTELNTIQNVNKEKIWKS